MDQTPLLVLTIGGTIDKIYSDALSAFTTGESEFPRLAEQVGLQCPYRLESVLSKDSLEMTDDDRALLRERVAGASESRVLVTHGTDTMTDTARALAPLPDRTIVLTGAMQPSRMRESDAAFNVGFALGVLQTLPPGVYIAMHGRVFSPDAVRKNRAAGRFEGSSEGH
ncbi:L-asparaginase [Tamilnaduibacter salinus]|uniref:Asparaginase n=2 Tax=Tamilnaduibacter salinus TaxID=1484056 RepID=A0A2A2I3C5_9GAMM|nr:asparaginase [Tamilnaduibacter salinus]PVY76337.1 L-asparaginase [Tamilnaduibacter salinus]